MGKHSVVEVPVEPITKEGKQTKVFGRPVEGKIQTYDAPTAQDDPKLFLEALDEFLAVSGVGSVHLVGYVPYFNDGDTCTFSVHEYGSGFTLTEEGLAYYGLEGKYNDNSGDVYTTDTLIGGDDSHLWHYKDTSTGSYKTNDYTEVYDDPSHEELEKAFTKFLSVPLSGKHDIFLQQAFGLHFDVTATKAGFSVEYFEHD